MVRGSTQRGGSWPALAAASAVLALTLAGCGTGSGVTATDPPDEPAPATTVPQTPATPDLDFAAAVADAEWSFAPDGLGAPMRITMADGTGVDDLSRTYTIGAPVIGEADGDGIPDAAITITQADGNAVTELWYIWLGGDDGTATQVEYPIARTTRCGDATHSVIAVDGGFEIDLTLRIPGSDDGRSCADGGTGTLVRTVGVQAFDGAPYPVQTAPILAWGGVCPASTWLDGIADTGIEGRAAPPASADRVTDPAAEIGVFELPPAPLVTADGARFFGFISDPASDAVVKMHCAFAG